MIRSPKIRRNQSVININIDHLLVLDIDPLLVLAQTVTSSDSDSDTKSKKSSNKDKHLSKSPLHRLLWLLVGSYSFRE